MRAKERIKELENLVGRLTNRLWLLESPPRYKAGDTVYQNGELECIVIESEYTSIYMIEPTYKYTLAPVESGAIKFDLLVKGIYEYELTSKPIKK